MTIIGIDHVQLAMPHGGEPQARAFFTGVLGMIELPKPAHLAISGGCWFASGSAHIHCGVEQDHVPAQRAHPALLVDDLAALRAKLESAGHTTRDDTPIEGYTRFFADDPFGNRLEFMQRV